MITSTPYQIKVFNNFIYIYIKKGLYLKLYFLLSETELESEIT